MSVQRFGIPSNQCISGYSPQHVGTQRPASAQEEREKRPLTHKPQEQRTRVLHGDTAGPRAFHAAHTITGDVRWLDVGSTCSLKQLQRRKQLETETMAGDERRYLHVTPTHCVVGGKFGTPSSCIYLYIGGI